MRRKQPRPRIMQGMDPIEAARQMRHAPPEGRALVPMVGYAFVTKGEAPSSGLSLVELDPQAKLDANGKPVGMIESIASQLRPLVVTDPGSGYFDDKGAQHPTPLQAGDIIYLAPGKGPAGPHPTWPKDTLMVAIGDVLAVHRTTE